MTPAMQWACWSSFMAIVQSVVHENAEAFIETGVYKIHCLLFKSIDIKSTDITVMSNSMHV